MDKITCECGSTDLLIYRLTTGKSSEKIKLECRKCGKKVKAATIKSASKKLSE